MVHVLYLINDSRCTIFLIKRNHIAHMIYSQCILLCIVDGVRVCEYYRTTLKEILFYKIYIT